MSNVYGRNQFRRWRLLEEGIDRFVMYAAKETLQFRKSLVNERSKLAFTGNMLLHQSLLESEEILEMQRI